VLLMKAGRITDEVDPGTVTEQELAELMTGESDQEGHH
jgi:ABC-type uncharacterized transport system ATPase subunit